MSVVEFPTKGRTVPALPTHMFKDSGITTELRKLSPSTLQDLTRAITKEWERSDDPKKRKPKAPIIEADGIVEENEADPEYQKQLHDWTQRLQAEINSRVLDFAAVYSVEVTIDHDALKRLRETHVMMGLPIEEDDKLSQDVRDKLLYVTRVCIATADDMQEFANAVFNRIAPSEEDVQAHIDTFPGDVSR